MKILYVISCNGGGRGGHNHSLNHISRAIGEKARVGIISIGSTESPVLKENPHYLKGICYRWYNLISLNKQVRKVLNSFQPDVVHCFDGGSALMLMLLPSMIGVRLMYTKCGGPNERQIVAQVTNQVILFSQENYDSYKGNKRFSKSQIHLMPNRVFDVPQLPLEQREIEKIEAGFNLVRIARIGKTYERSFLQAINLAAFLGDFGKLKLFIIGHVKEKDALDRLKEYALAKGVDVQFITKRYTEQASRLLYLADAVVGTGRGVMEAMSMTIPTFVPLSNSDYPCLLFEKSFQALLATNFSPRGKIADNIVEESLELSIRLLKSQAAYSQQLYFTKKMATKYFRLTEEIIARYFTIYRSLSSVNYFVQIYRNWFAILYYMNSIRKSQNRNSR